MSDGSFPRSLMIPQAFGPDGRALDLDTITAQQGNRPRHSRAFCKIYMNGRDLTSVLDPVLISVRVTDKKFGSSVASITIDDQYGRIPNPPDSSRCSIMIGWPDDGLPKQFSGVLSSVYSYGQRQSGRMMDLEFTSYDMGSDGKSTIRMNWGAGKDVPSGSPKQIPFSVIAKELAEKAKIKNFKIAPRIAEMTRSRWDVTNEFPFGALERFARELGGNFKIDGDGGGISDPSSNQAADGTQLKPVLCIVGENVLAWRIVPGVKRSQWGSLWHGFFDRDAAAPRVESASPAKSFGFEAVTGKHMSPFPTNDAEMAKTSALASAGGVVAKRTTGWTVIDGMPLAVAGGKFDLHGYKPGVDGMYRGEEIEHQYARGGGYITRIDLEGGEFSETSGVLRNWKGQNN